MFDIWQQLIDQFSISKNFSSHTQSWHKQYTYFSSRIILNLMFFTKGLDPRRCNRCICIGQKNNNMHSSVRIFMANNENNTFCENKVTLKIYVFIKNAKLTSLKQWMLNCTQPPRNKVRGIYLEPVFLKVISCVHI